jgi:RNA-directed DNA polymerase
MQKPKHEWYRARRYLHFDPPISISKAEKVVTNPALVARHAFYPFIGYEIVSKKLKRDASSGKLSKETKLRPIGYAAHLDSHIYAYYAHRLSKLYEAKLKEYQIGDSILAFRSLGKSNIDFALNAFREIETRGECSAVAIDISQFFDNIDHALLKKRWSNLLEAAQLPADHYNIFLSLTRFAAVPRNDVYLALGISKTKPEKGRIRLCSAAEFREKIRSKGLIAINKKKFGIPQGSPISALLSNVYLLDFDFAVSQEVQRLNGIYYRYCDDMLILLPQRHKTKAIEFVREEIARQELKINEQKTVLIDFHRTQEGLSAERPLQYLGFTFDGKRILIRSAALARYSERMKRGVRIAKLTKIKYNKRRIDKGEMPRELYKRKLYERYSHLGHRNFVRYGLRASHCGADSKKKSKRNSIAKREIGE